MVSPHESWEDVEEGYRTERVGVFVEPRSIGGGDGPTRSKIEPVESAAIVYAVTMCRPLGSALESETTLVSFDDGRTAWEYANLVTHFVAESADANFAESQLRGRVGPPADRWEPDELVSDRGAFAVLREQVGHHVDKIEHLVNGTPALVE
ncbi:hypothetical protein ACFO5R_08040 [Halosolutus amylolyticus]|uniref:Uncharacterized protein n=1 Tax=Halosolutus amylolyticus TaxID=2932267 RepID=A0ABD5PN74_9EURY|nr:hypothetical protein [Halosolutus amylolyticus]